MHAAEHTHTHTHTVTRCEEARLAAFAQQLYTNKDYSRSTPFDHNKRCRSVIFFTHSPTPRARSSNAAAAHIHTHTQTSRMRERAVCPYGESPPRALWCGTQRARALRGDDEDEADD